MDDRPDSESNLATCNECGATFHHDDYQECPECGAIDFVCDED